MTLSRHAMSTTFPYTTLFRSVADAAHSEIVIKEQAGDRERPGRGSVHHLAIRAKNADELHYWEEQVKARGFHSTGILDRSEEHTSELQSRGHLVCRLLLEKKH